MKICFVGGGNIAQAIIDGLLKSQLPPEAIVCIERNQEKIDLLKSQKITVASFECLSEDIFDLIVLAVKPKDALVVAQKIEDLAPHSNILTVVAGIGISKYPTSASIIRSMPNTASAYNRALLLFTLKIIKLLPSKMHVIYLSEWVTLWLWKMKMIFMPSPASLAAAKLSYFKC